MSITDSNAEAPATDLDSIYAEVTAELAGETPAEEVVTEDEANTEAEGEQEAEAPSEAEGESGQSFTVKIDGQEVEVPLDELLNGYTRQADYTRKTQALSEKAKRLDAFEALDRAFQEDPVGTLNDLARSLGVNLGPEQAPVESDVDPDDPMAKELAEMRAWRRDMEAREALREQAARQEAVDRELEAVKVTFSDPDLDEAALLEFAISNQIPKLELAYKAMRFEEAKAPPPAEDTKLAAKRAAPKVVGGGNRKVGVVKGGSSKPGLRDAFAESWSEVLS